MTDPDHAEALSLLEDATIDPLMVPEIVDAVLYGDEEEVIEKLLCEMPITEDQAQAIHEYLKAVLPGKDLRLEEIPADLIDFVPVSEMLMSGNPFAYRTSYFVRRGLRVFAAYPVKEREGDGFLISGTFHDTSTVRQIWRSVPADCT
nr:hypothetical protein [Neorhizobium tomejilense]